MRHLKHCVLLVVFMFPFSAYAHPGRTASDGCHYCRTNCADWGEVEDARHCHGGSSDTAPVVQESNSVPVVQPTKYVPTKVINTPIPTAIPTLKLEPTNTLVPTSSPVSTKTPIPTKIPEPTAISEASSEEVRGVSADTTEVEPASTGDAVAGLGILGGMGYGVFWGGKKLLGKLLG